MKQHLVSMKVVDQSVSRILRVKFELGLFDNPMVDPAKAAALANTPEHRELALEAARRAMVLLKNERNVLPLSKSAKRVVVLGDVANGPTPLGGHSGDPGARVSFLEGLKAESLTTQFDFVPGCGNGSLSSLPLIDRSSLFTPRGLQGLKVEYWNNEGMTGAPVLTRNEPGVNFSFDGESPDPLVHPNHFSARWTGYVVAPESGDYSFSATSDDGMRVKVGGKLICDDWSVHASHTVIGKTHLEAGEKTPIEVDYFQGEGQAVARLGWSQTGQTNSLSGHITHECMGADAVIVFGSIDEGEGSDRAYLGLPGNQDDCIQAAVASGAPVTVVLAAGAPVTMEKWGDSVPAVLDCWYPGEEGARATAETLFGDSNPGGKLPITFPKTVGQCPIYYNLEPSGRGYDYVDSTGKPLFAFGHGLSYTKFDYSGLKIEPKGKNSWEVSVSVKNAGDRVGDEVVQLYTHQSYSTVIRPLEELKDFQRIHLEAGASKTITFKVGFEQLAFLNAGLKTVTEAAPVDIMIGSASDDIRVHGEVKTVNADRP